MTRFSAGIVMTGSDGYVHVRIWDKSYFLCPEDRGMLLFVGETVPLLHKNPDPSSGPSVTSGSVVLNPSGRSVIIEVGAGRFMVPRDRFLAVAFGEDISSIIFEIPSYLTEREIISPCKGGRA